MRPTKFSPALAAAPLLVASLLSLSVGCSPSHFVLKSAADSLSDSSGPSSFARDRDPEFVRDAVPFALETMESLGLKLPDHVGIRVALAAGLTQYGYAFVQQPVELGGEANSEAGKAALARATHFYLRAREHGLDGLKIAHGITIEQLRSAEKDRTKALASLEKEDVALIYWTLVPWGAAISLNKRDLELVGDVPVIAALLDRALTLDESFDQGALHEFSITFDSARPEGTTPEKEKAHFERARVLANGEKISPLVTYAEAVLGPAQDKKGYQALLNEAASYDVDQPKARNDRLANVLSQRRAKFLLAHQSDVFSD